MNRQDVELILSEQVSERGVVAARYQPAAGTSVFIDRFVADCADAPNALGQLIWDYGGTEKVIWSISGSGEMPFKYEIDKSETDGTKVLAMVLDNGQTSKAVLSGYTLLTVIE